MNIVEITALALVSIGLIVLGVLAVEAWQAERDSRPDRQQADRCPTCGH